MKIQTSWLLVLLLMGLPVYAETLFETDFAARGVGVIGLGQEMKDHDGSASFWEGPQPRENGYFAIKEAPEAAGGETGKPVLAFFDNSSEQNKTPVFSIELAKRSEAPKKLVFETKFLVPPLSSYQGLISLGKGSWDGAAAIFVLAGGKLNVWQPGGTLMAVGNYEVTAWTTLRVTLDMTKKIYDVEVNGQKTGSAIPWAHTKYSALTNFEILSDLSPRDQNGEAVLYIEYVTISAE